MSNKITEGCLAEIIYTSPYFSEHIGKVITVGKYLAKEKVWEIPEIFNNGTCVCIYEEDLKRIDDNDEATWQQIEQITCWNPVREVV